MNQNLKKCVYQKKCGGCVYAQVSYQRQLREKQKYVEKFLNKYAKVLPILGMKDPYFYRNKVHRVIAGDSKGNCFTGIYERGSHRVVQVDQCLIENRKADRICQSIADLMKSFKMKPYNEDTGYGFLRHILVRCGIHSGEYLVVLVTASPVFPSKKHFVKALLKEHPEITSIVLNVNHRHTSMVLGDREEILYGRGYITDQLCGKNFRISPKSFYQVNTLQTEKLYGTALDFADLRGNETVMDTYCGIGTIGIIAADRAEKVLGVELNPQAVKDAISNAKTNKIRNIRFIKADAGDFMVQMAARGQKADVVFMDPPRSGSSREFLTALQRLSPKKIVYISCNPETLARDLAMLTGKWYRVEKIQPVDLFPWTEHIENVCSLKRVK